MTKASKPKIEDQTDLLSDQQGTQALDIGSLKIRTEGTLSTPLQEVKEAELLQEKQTENIEIFQTGVELRTASQGEGRDEETVSEDSSSAQIAGAKTSTDDKERPGIETVLNENSEMPTATETPSKQANDITEMTPSLDGDNSDIQAKIEQNAITRETVCSQTPRAKLEIFSEIRSKIAEKRINEISKPGLLRIAAIFIFLEWTLKTLLAFTLAYEDSFPKKGVLILSFTLVTGASFLEGTTTKMDICSPYMHFL